jgi:hypothetical protein
MKVKAMNKNNGIIKCLSGNFFVIILLGFWLTTNCYAQLGIMPSHVEQYNLTAGPYNGGNGKNPIEIEPVTIEIENAQWLRVIFNSVNLGTQSYIKIISRLDGSEQTLNSQSINQWKNTSAYFNGSAIDITLYVVPGDLNIHYQVDEVIVGDSPENLNEPPLGICDLYDDRVPSNYPCVGRLVSGKDGPAVGTAFLISTGNMVSAFHCLDEDDGSVVQFNVPSNGTHPDAVDQYVIGHVIRPSVLYDGNDWAVFDVNPNSNNQMPINRQTQTAIIEPNHQLDDGDNLVVVGYGETYDLGNYPQQISDGPYVYYEDPAHPYFIHFRVDAAHGSSGGPIIIQDLSKTPTPHVVGILTLGGCIFDLPSTWNGGTSIDNPDLMQALSTNIVRLEQKKQDGSNVGTMGLWNTNSNIFERSSAPTVFEIPIGANSTLHADTLRYDNQKYYKWDTQTDLVNPKTFNVGSNQLKLIAKLLPVTGDITIRNEIQGATAYIGGIIKFKDPWLIDTLGQYGRSNQGMGAPLKQRSSPFYPDFNTTYDLTDKYNGVLLNQHTYLGNYYSVQVPIEQDIGEFHCRLIDNNNWSATGASLFDLGNSPSGYSRRAVVFTASLSPITVKAKYQAISASINAPAILDWNMTSIPAVIGNFASTSVYPMAQSLVYVFQNGYVPKTTLQNGEGYWVKLPSIPYVNYTGTPIFQGSYSVNQGWNIVGSISVAVPVSSLGNNSETPYYKLTLNGYVAVDSLKPGGGYWVKMKQNGTLVFQAPQGGMAKTSESTPSNIETLISSLDKFTIIDGEGKKQDLFVRNGSIVSELEGINFEMPPPPMGINFDARFVTEKLVEVAYPQDGETALSIAVSTDTYPVTVTYDIKPENGINYSIGESSNGMGKNNLSQLNGRSGNFVINEKSAGKILLVSNAHYVAGSELPKEYILGQNYPNPFNPTTVINYQLPVNSFVTLRVYDVLGKEVATVVNEYKEAGYYQASFNATHLSSGVYFYKLVAGNYTSVKKLLFAK